MKEQAKRTIMLRVYRKQAIRELVRLAGHLDSENWQAARNAGTYLQSIVELAAELHQADQAKMEEETACSRQLA